MLANETGLPAELRPHERRCSKNRCRRRRHSAANLHGLMVGLVEKPLLRAVMRETRGNQVRAAQLLGINRNTLRKKLKEHGIDPDAV
jgi:DNA-binding protein Fis